MKKFQIGQVRVGVNEKTYQKNRYNVRPPLRHSRLVRLVNLLMEGTVEGKNCNRRQK